MTGTRHIAVLLYKALEGKLSDDENGELERWRREHREHEAFFEQLFDEKNLSANIRLHHPENRKELERRILEKIESKLSFKIVPFFKRSFFRVAVAACITLLMMAGGYLLFLNKQKSQTTVAQLTSDIKAPDKSKATITLGDGRTVSIDSLTSFDQANVEVRKTVDGQIAYSGTGTEVVFNTLSNPRGSKVIDLVLNDGSHVWLNAGSSVTYPVAFIGKDRKVTISGEAYFEVKKDNRTFLVSKGEMNVQVLGTHFNVNAYEDEQNTRVTLLEGSVNVNGTIIKPGQQALRQAQGDIEVVNNVNLEQVMAWKNGTFSFSSADIKTIMREIARWYDVDVSYAGTITEKFRVDINRNTNVSTVFKILEETGKVHFKIEGKKITVSP